VFYSLPVLADLKNFTTISNASLASGKLKGITAWLVSLLATAFVVVIAYFWLDRPIALWVGANVQLHQQTILKALTGAPNPLIILSGIIIVAFGLKALTGRSFAKYEAASLLCSVSIIVTESIKNDLKLVFGRTWPQTWIENNPSFVRDGVYGFNFWHGGVGYQSFPSGHMAAVCTAAVVLSLYYPKYKWVFVLACIIVGAVLIGTNYHFLSDVIAGAFLGGSIAWMNAAIWDAHK
jgi:membrane-associated phospholipid phosphatase